MKKMLNAFKAFELQNQKSISGGAVVTCTDGKVCDIRMSNGSMQYDVSDPGLGKGTAIAERSVSSVGSLVTPR